MNARRGEIIYYDVMRNENIRKGRRVEKSEVVKLTKASQDVWFTHEMIFYHFRFL